MSTPFESVNTKSIGVLTHAAVLTKSSGVFPTRISLAEIFELFEVCLLTISNSSLVISCQI